MENILKSDIFFFVTTISVVVVTLVLIIVGIYATMILRDMRYIMKDIKSKYGFIQHFLDQFLK